MNWFEEVRQSLAASCLLLMRDVSGYGLFNTSEAGFWRSFSAVVLLAPLYLYATTIETKLAFDGTPPEPSLLWAAAGLLVQWVAWPLIMAWVARFAGLSRFYARYIIAYNWSSVLVIAAFLPPLLIFELGLIGTGMTAFLSLVVLVGSLYYRWYIALTALECPAPLAMALVLGDVVLSIAVNQFIG